MVGKLATVTSQNKKLRAKNREKDDIIAGKDEVMAGLCEPPSTMQRLGSMLISNGAAYIGGRAFVAGQQKGLMPTSVPVDMFLGVSIEALLAFFPGLLSELGGEFGSGLSNGAMGRIAAFQQLPTTEIAGRQALLLPAPAPGGGVPPGGGLPPGGGVPQG